LFVYINAHRFFSCDPLRTRGGRRLEWAEAPVAACGAEEGDPDYIHLPVQGWPGQKVLIGHAASLTPY